MVTSYEKDRKLGTVKCKNNIFVVFTSIMSDVTLTCLSVKEIKKKIILT